MILILKWILFALALIFTAWIVQGISITGFLNALVGSLVLSILGALINIIDNKKAT